MSQLNLLQILPGDDLSVVVDKSNYNWNQIILNGGGPRGLRGLIGAPGMPGKQGFVGSTGPVGEEGTHTYIDMTPPSLYPFGTGGEILPRTGDIYIEATATYLSYWEYATTGGTGNYWNLVNTITAAGGAGVSKLVYDGGIYGTSPTWTSTSNDPSIAGKFLFGSPDALNGTFIIDPLNPISSITPKLQLAFSGGFGGGYNDSLVNFASARNQLRILDINRPSAEIGTTAGGIVHSVETTALFQQVYRIKNADTLGDNYFTLSLNSSPLSLGSLIYGDTRNRLGVGMPEFTPLIATATINGSMIVGTSNFWTGATVTGGIGAVIEGNLAVGRNKNTFATGGFFNRSGSFGSSLLVDTTQSIGASAAVSEIFLGAGMYDNQLSPGLYNYWSFKHDAFNNIGNSNYRKLMISTRQSGASFSSGVTANIVTAGLTGDGVNFSSQVSIDNSELYDKFSIGNQLHNIVSIGNQTVGLTGSMHVSFNLSRSPIADVWRRMGTTSGNSGKTVWSGPNMGLAFTMFKSDGTGNVTNITDADVYLNTKLYLDNSGSLTMSEMTSAIDASAVSYPFFVNFGATGTTGQSTTAFGWRRYIGLFGSATEGSPVIAKTNGVTQSVSIGITAGVGVTASVLPHYTWYGSEMYGLFLGQETVVNGAKGKIVGIASGGTAALTLTGNYNSEIRMGIYQRDPLSRVHIGEKLTVHDGITKFIGYNLYNSASDGLNYRISGTTAPGGTHQGAFEIRYIENNSVDGASFLSRFSNLGTKIAFIPHAAGGIVSSLEDPAVSTPAYKGMIISPSAVGPSGYDNLSGMPQVAIGVDNSTFNSEKDATDVIKRGTLSIGAQYRTKRNKSITEDYYNIGLYDYSGNPVTAIYTTSPGGKFSTRQFGINYLSSTGSVTDDIPLMYASIDDLTTPLNRVGRFGADFRWGIGATPNSYTVASDPTYDLATLVVGPFTRGNVPSNQSIIAKGALVVDQSAFSETTSGIFIKDTVLNGSSVASSYAGDWGIQYLTATIGSSQYKGLGFWKPMGTSSLNDNQKLGGGVLFLTDTGKVGISTTTFTGTPVGGSSSVALKLSVGGVIGGTNFATTSDLRLKENIVNIDGPLKRILRTRPVFFNFKNSPGVVQGGFIAQEISEVIPESAMLMDNGMYMLNYNTVFAVAVGAIQEQQAIIEKQIQTIENLEAKLDKIEKLLIKHNIL